MFDTSEQRAAAVRNQLSARLVEFGPPLWEVTFPPMSAELHSDCSEPDQLELPF